MLILVHRKMNVLYVWLVSSKYTYRLQSYGKSPITSGSPLVDAILKVSSLFQGPLAPIKSKSAIQKIRPIQKYDYPLIFDEER